jgi:hypothetical protein
MSVPESFFLPGDAPDRWVATELTRGPWSPALQHGGPPAALLARALERDLAAIEPASRIARVTVDFVRPLAIGPLAVEVERVRIGRQVQELRGRLLTGGRELCRMAALGIRAAAAPLDLGRSDEDAAAGQPPPPAASAPFEFPFFTTDVGYHRGVEVRFAAGAFGTGVATAWIRMLRPLVPGEEPSPLQRVVIAADSGNGVSAALDTDHFTFINPDLTVYLHRAPVGEWICLDATTTPHPWGIGLAQSRLHDEAGAIGCALQSLVVAVR